MSADGFPLASGLARTHDASGHNSCSCHPHLSENQVRFRLRLALASGAVLGAGWTVEAFVNSFSGSCLIAFSCILMAGPVISDAWAGLRCGRVGFPSLVALAFLACAANGSYKTAGLVALFMIMANQLENRTAIGARHAIEALVRATPQTVHLIGPDGMTSGQPVASLQVGNLIEIRPGETVPVDGKVERGDSSVDESSITGESVPVDKAAGERVYAGTSNLTGALNVRVEKLGDDTTVGRVKRMILAAAQSKLPLSGVMEKNAGWYTPLIVMVAILVYYFNRSRPGAVEQAIAVLIMACPCSIILAAPSVMIAAITAAARAGILVKNAVELEFFHRVEHIFFDKTGTLTTGEMEVARMKSLCGREAAGILREAGSLASKSNHPSARAVAKAHERARLAPLQISGVKEIHGKGLTGTVDGKAAFLGRPEWVELSLRARAPESEGAPHATRLLYGREGEGICAEFLLEDHLREDAAKSLAELRGCGVRTLTLLTGDSRDAAEMVGAAVGFDEIAAKCLPEDKLRRLNEVKARGVITAVVGDGINDAPVLAAGDVGIAMGALGSQVAIESASITLMSSSLDRLPFLHRLSAQAKWLIWVNLGIGLLVITAGLLFVMMGRLSPVMAALLHNVSALVILFNSARLVNMKPAAQS